MFRSKEEDREYRKRLHKCADKRDLRDENWVKAQKEYEARAAMNAQDRILTKEVSKIWKVYDRDCNGVLDKDEMRKFIEEMTDGLTGDTALTEERLNKVF